MKELPKSLSSGPRYPIFGEQMQAFLNQYLIFQVHSFSASERRFCCHREVRETYLDLFPERPQSPALRLNIITSTLPRDWRKWAFFPYWLSFLFWLQKYMDCPVFPLFLCPLMHTYRAKGYIKIASYQCHGYNTELPYYPENRRNKGNVLKFPKREELAAKAICVCTAAAFATFKLEGKIKERQEGGNYQQQTGYTGKCQWRGK